jgi:hypothetical protein
VNPATPGVFYIYEFTSGTPPIGIPPVASGTVTLKYTSNAGAGLSNPIPFTVPFLGTSPPTITFNSSTQLFTLNLDTYGFGGTQLSNADDGYLGNNDDVSYVETTYEQTLNSSYNDQARDSYGLTGCAAMFVTQPYKISRKFGQCFDERLILEGNDYFHNLFGNWPALLLLYVDPRTNIQTSYVRYLPQATTAGLNVQYPLPLYTPTPVTSGYLPYGRVAGNTAYFYTFPQDYASVGNMWQPVEAIVVTTDSVPIVDDQTRPPTFLGDTATAKNSSQTASTYEKVLAEFSLKPSYGQEYRSEIQFEPLVRTLVDMTSGSDFRQFDYQVRMRMKQTQLLRDIPLSRGGNANFRYILQRKNRSDQ